MGSQPVCEHVDPTGGVASNASNASTLGVEAPSTPNSICTFPESSTPTSPSASSAAVPMRASRRVHLRKSSRRAVRRAKTSPIFSSFSSSPMDAMASTRSRAQRLLEASRLSFTSQPNRPTGVPFLTGLDFMLRVPIHRRTRRAAVSTDRRKLWLRTPSSSS